MKFINFGHITLGKKVPHNINWKLYDPIPFDMKTASEWRCKHVNYYTRDRDIINISMRKCLKGLFSTLIALLFTAKWLLWPLRSSYKPVMHLAGIDVITDNFVCNSLVLRIVMRPPNDVKQEIQETTNNTHSNTQ